MENNKNNNNNKVLYYSISAIVLLTFIIFGAMKLGGSGVLTGNLDQNTNQTLTIPKEDTNAKVGLKKKGKIVNVANDLSQISYSEALVKYRDSRIQLDEQCQAFPNEVTYKNGTVLMIDNRAPMNRTVMLGLPYPIKEYGFQIVKLSTPTFPTKLFIDCDKSQNVATILVQE